MNKISKNLFILLFTLLFLTSACKANISRNDDSSLTVETAISQQELQDVITASIADPLIQELIVSLQSDYVLVSGTRQRLNDAIKTDKISFRLDLGVSNGQLTSTISNAQIDGVAIEQNRVDNWNQTVSNRLAILGQKNEKSTLQSVTVTSEKVSMVWNVAR